MSLEQLIPVVNKLQDVFHSVGMLDTIDLPQIAVVGSQSSGKSSVLESIVGRDFLPRGTGIVTRRPLVLQLTHVPRKKDSDGTSDEWGEFMHKPDRKYTDFNEIRNEIMAETDRVTGTNKGISPLPIHLRIYSPNVLNLTLIDLPGVTKVPVGDQPKDIEKQIRRMILQFIQKPNCIILAVTAANTDLANSDALKLAREVDPKGDRTLGVLTKVDLMDKDTDAMDVLMGKIYKLRKGFIAVVNRSQSDINNNKPISEAIVEEENFFKNHPSYGQIAERLGTKYLARTLNQILLSHIRETLPEIKEKISALMAQAQHRLNEYGAPLSESNMSQGAILLQMLTQFATDYVEAIDGRNPDISTNELFGGARINHIFTRKYVPYLNKLDAFEGLTEYDIRTAIRNAKGPRTSLFIPEASFEMLVKRQVKMLENPSLRCVDQVFEELKAIMEHSNRVLLRFPKLREKVHEFVTSLLKEYSAPLKEFIRNLIAIELSYINTNHPDFFGGGQTSMMLMDKMRQMRELEDEQDSRQGANGRDPLRHGRQAPSSGRSSNVQDRETMELEIIRTLLESYFGIVRKNIGDTVPKSIMHFLVNKSKQNLQSELVRALYKEELFDGLLSENEEIAARRKATAKMLRVLQKANDVLSEIRDLKL